MQKILIIEDNKEISNLLKLKLEKNYSIVSTKYGNEAVSYIIGHIIDLVILDLGLPDIDGQEVLKKVRSFNKDISIVVLSARDNDDDKIKALDNGADDYVVKPFSAVELEARIRNILKRKIASDEQGRAIFRNGDLYIDYINHIVKLDDEELKLTNMEYKILELLSKNLDKTLTHGYIVSQVWGSGYEDTGSLRVFVSALRKKIEKDPYHNKFIRTDSGIGYRMNKIK